MKHRWNHMKPIFEVRRNVQSQVVLSCFEDVRCWKMFFWSNILKPFPPLIHGLSTPRRRLGTFFSLTEKWDVDVSSLLQAERELHSLLQGPVKFSVLEGAMSVSTCATNQVAEVTETKPKKKTRVIESNCLVSRHLPYQFIWPQSCCALLNHQLFPEGCPLAVFLDLRCHLHPLLGSLHSHPSPNTWLYLGCPGKKNNHNYASPIYLEGRTCRFSTPCPRANVGPCPSGFPWARWVCPPIP